MDSSWRGLKSQCKHSVSQLIIFSSRHSLKQCFKRRAGDQEIWDLGITLEKSEWWDMISIWPALCHSLALNSDHLCDFSDSQFLILYEGIMITVPQNYNDHLCCMQAKFEYKNYWLFLLLRWCRGFILPSSQFLSGGNFFIIVAHQRNTHQMRQMDLSFSFQYPPSLI